MARNLRIAVGYRTAHRSADAVILASGGSQESLQAAVNAAGPEFQRFEFGVFTFTRKARKQFLNNIPNTVGGTQQAAESVPAGTEETPSPSEQPGWEGDPGAEGPTLGDPAASPKRRR